MADTKTSQLPAASTADGTEVFASVQSTADRKMTLAQVIDYAVNVRKLMPTVLTVATLPAVTGLSGSRSFVSDASATTFASIVAGSGSNKVPVYCDGTNWRIG